MLLLHPDRDPTHYADGAPREATELPDYQLGPDGQLLWAPGTGIAPPATHLLDALVRNFALVDELEAIICHAVHTMALVGARPACDLCQGTAGYDAYLPRDRMWGIACTSCYRRHTSQLLGAGRGQMLVTWSEVPAQVQAICGALAKRLGRPSIRE